MALTLEYLTVAQALILAFGAIVVFYSARAYRRTKTKAMLLLSVGFGFVTVGAAIAGVLFNLLGVDLVSVVTVQAFSQAVGFFIIVYSLTRTKD